MTFFDRSNELVPDAEAFVKWVRRALADIKKRPSHFLLDDTPGSKNRVSYLLNNPDFIRMKLASRLEVEIRQEAARQGITLLPLPMDSDAGKTK